MPITIVKSSLLSDSSIARLAEQVSVWISNNSINNRLHCIHKTYDASRQFQESIFTTTYNGNEEPVGISVSAGATIIRLSAAAKVYVDASGKPHYTVAANAEGEESGNPVTLRSLKPEKDESGQYHIGVWYGQTSNNGILVGLYTAKEYMGYPAYIGTVRNEFKHETLIYALQLNGGAYPISGQNGDTGHKVNYRMSVGKAMVVGGNRLVGGEIKSRETHTVFIQHSNSHRNKYPDLEGGVTDSRNETTYYSPLYATLSDEWTQLFQVDSFYAASFLSAYRPEILENIGVTSGTVKNFVTLSHDGVAFRTGVKSLCYM